MNSGTAPLEKRVYANVGMRSRPASRTAQWLASERHEAATGESRKSCRSRGVCKLVALLQQGGLYFKQTLQQSVTFGVALFYPAVQLSNPSFNRVNGSCDFVVEGYGKATPFLGRKPVVLVGVVLSQEMSM